MRSSSFFRDGWPGCGGWCALAAVTAVSAALHLVAIERSMARPAGRGARALERDVRQDASAACRRYAGRGDALPGRPARAAAATSVSRAYAISLDTQCGILERVPKPGAHDE